jgi:hypothetical protein
MPGLSSFVGTVGAAVLAAGAAAAQTRPAPPPKADIVSTAGCLKEASPGAWTLANATDPVPSIANAPAPKDLPAMPVFGPNSFQLIGVSIFDLPAHRDHTVVVKGLLIKASPVSRLNVTSVTMVAASCATGPAK